MNLRTLSTFFATLGLGAVLVWQSPAQDARPMPAGPEKSEDGVEVLARGPVHEAYADAVVPNPEATPVVPKAPPEAIEELPPETKPEGAQWIGGYWAWDEDRSDFIWVSGFWRVPPPDRQWVPGHWDKVTGGYQWVPGVWTPTDDPEIEYNPPPPATVESGPSTPAPDNDHVYAPGCWVYRETRYVWQPGYWVAARPGWVWVPAHYVWTPAGYVFVDGYWDYPLEDRGMLFAPVAFAPQTIVQVGFTYTPTYCVRDDFLFSAMFVRPARSCYYFGDYFGPAYARAGYTAWVDFRIGRGCPDPLFGYYAHRYHGTPGWERDLRGVYAGREAGRIARPPHTLVQQNTVINNINVQKNSNNVNVNHVKVLAPVTQINKQNLRVTQVAKAERVQAAQHAAQLRTVAKARANAEAGIVAKGGPVGKHEAPRRVKLDNLPAVPKVPANAKINRTPPPPPARLRQKTDGPKAPAARPQQPGGNPGARPNPPPQQPRPQPRPAPAKPNGPNAGPNPKPNVPPLGPGGPRKEGPPAHPKKDGPHPQQQHKPQAQPPRAQQPRPAQKPAVPPAVRQQPPRQAAPKPQQPAAKPQQRPAPQQRPVRPQPNRAVASPPRQPNPAVRQTQPRLQAQPRPQVHVPQKPQVQPRPQPRPQVQARPQAQPRQQPRVIQQPRPQPRPAPQIRRAPAARPAPQVRPRPAPRPAQRPAHPRPRRK